VLKGNPFVLVEFYKPYCLSQLRNLRLFDDTPIAKDEGKKNRTIKSEKQTQGTPELELNNDISFDLNISVLGGITGVKLAEEHFEDPAVFEALEPQDRSSRFWIQTEFLEQPIKSEVRLWETQFQKDDDVGKTDFKVSLRFIMKLLEDANQPQTPQTHKQSVKESPKQDANDGDDDDKEDTKQADQEQKSKPNKVEPITVNFSHSLYESILGGLWVELYEEYPVLIESENDDGETIRRADLVDSKPRFKTAIRGVARVNTEKWILQSGPAKTTISDTLSQKFCMKNFFYKIKYRAIPEFFMLNHNVSLKPSETEAIDSYVKSKRDKMAQQEAEEREKAAEKETQKKDPKKDKAAKKADDKNAVAVEVNDPEDIPFAKDYTLIEKNYKQNISKANKGEFPVPGKLDGVHSSKKHETSKDASKEVTTEQRERHKQKKIMKDYDIILSLKSWLTIEMAMNQPEPVEEVEQEEEPPVPDKKNAKGKKK